MKILFYISIYLFPFTIDGQSTSDTSKVEMLTYPSFLQSIQSNDQETKIIIYSYDKINGMFSANEFSPTDKNFTANTFYVKKTLLSKKENESNTWEFFRIEDNKWIEISDDVKNEQSFWEVLVTDEIIKRDTIMLLDAETYKELWYLIEYQKAIEMRPTSAIRKQGHKP